MRYFSNRAEWAAAAKALSQQRAYHDVQIWVIEGGDGSAALALDVDGHMAGYWNDEQWETNEDDPSPPLANGCLEDEYGELDFT